MSASALASPRCSRVSPRGLAVLHGISAPDLHHRRYKLSSWGWFFVALFRTIGAGSARPNLGGGPPGGVVPTQFLTAPCSLYSPIGGVGRLLWPPTIWCASGLWSPPYTDDARPDRRLPLTAHSWCVSGRPCELLFASARASARVRSLSALDPIQDASGRPRAGLPHASGPPRQLDIRGRNSRIPLGRLRADIPRVPDERAEEYLSEKSFIGDVGLVLSPPCSCSLRRAVTLIMVTLLGACSCPSWP